jgi:hypothetical protein
MKNLSLSATPGVALLIIASLIPQPAFSQTYYPMVCRAGGDMSGAIPASGIAGVPSRGTRISISFRKASAAYSRSADTIRPGECAWMDRAINASEPDGITFTLNTQMRVTFRNTNRAALLFDGVGGTDYNEIHEIMGTLLDGDYFRFEATNAGRGTHNTFNARNFTAGRP